MEDRLLSINEAAELAGCRIETLRRWDTDGKLVPYRTQGGHRRYGYNQLMAFLGREVYPSNPTVVVTYYDGGEGKSEWLRAEIPPGSEGEVRAYFETMCGLTFKESTMEEQRKYDPCVLVGGYGDGRHVGVEEGLTQVVIADDDRKRHYYTRTEETDENGRLIFRLGDAQSVMTAKFTLTIGDVVMDEFTANAIVPDGMPNDFVKRQKESVLGAVYERLRVKLGHKSRAEIMSELIAKGVIG